jgi:hypothetical protein
MSLQEQAHRIIEKYTGYPDLPTGRPCGVLAYMFGHGKQMINISRPDGSSTEELVEVPFFDPGSSVPPQPFYAVIETNPVGLLIPTLAKGAQDLIAVKNEERLIFELGQPRDLVRQLRALGVNKQWDISSNCSIQVNEMHSQMIIALLGEGYTVRVEAPFEAAVRETREEHGFDLERCRNDVVSLRFCTQRALSKRRPESPIEHYLYVAQVKTFDTTLLATSTIVEEKNPLHYGNVYQEYGMYLSLREMWERYKEAEYCAGANKTLQDRAKVELIVTKSRLALLGRVEAMILHSRFRRPQQDVAPRDRRTVLDLPDAVCDLDAVEKWAGAS